MPFWLAAKDEGFVNSLIEAADAGVDIATLGVGGLIKSLLGQGAKKAGESVLKTGAKALAKYVLNVLGAVADRRLGPQTGPRMLLTGKEAAGQKKTASTVEAGEYRAVRPENVELPTVPVINLSMKDVAGLNGGVLPESGGYMRKTAIGRAQIRLGLDQREAAYIPASNVLRNGEEYVLKITKASLDKMFSPSDDKAAPVETVAVVENLERIANNGVYFRSEGDRKGRDQIQGVDHLMTTVYIDGAPYVVDMRVRIAETGVGTQAQNVLYYFTPEAITAIKKADDGTSAAGRQASDGEAPPSTINRIAPNYSAVKIQDMQLGGKRLRLRRRMTGAARQGWCALRGETPFRPVCALECWHRIREWN